MEFKKDRLGLAIGKVDELIAMKDDLPKVVVSQLLRIRKILRWHLKNSTGKKRANGAP